MVKNWLSLSVIGNIWAFIIFILRFSLYGVDFHIQFTFSYLIIIIGSLIGIIIVFFYDEKVGNIICFISGIIFIVYHTMLNWGGFYIDLLFYPYGDNYTPLLLVLIGSIIGYSESLREEGKKVRKKGLILSLIGGVLSFHMFLNTLPISIYITIAMSHLMISCGAIIGVIAGLLYNDKFGSIVCFSSGMIYIIYRSILSWGLFFVDLVIPLSYNFTSFILVILGGIIGYAESLKDEEIRKF